MENRLSCYEFLWKNAGTGKWAERILTELGFLLEVSACHGNSMDLQILSQLEILKASFLENGAITKADALNAEEALREFSALAKAYDVSCVAHAHIDMNWMWGFQETAGVTIDTFRTMLQLLKEYPQFTFSQSQASVYQIVEAYAPQMLDEIRRYVQEGRWELTASTWVENEENMADGEAMARHILYTKRYLSELFRIPREQLRLDFEPDTFGHPHILPEVLQQGGVDYYYHCRGAEGPYIYNWRAPSGAEVLTYREPKWYNQTIEPDLFLHVPSFCAEYKIPCYLKVYGVGDHGGGPTRRDIEKILDMATWPLFPDIHFGTLHGFFDKLSAYRAQFETVDAELNYVFTGCYTSQSGIKKANRIGESRLKEAEALDVIAADFCENYRTANSFESAWKKILFNQFHDILPGSGVRETREFAMGQFQHAMAASGINATTAMHALNREIDTSGLALSDTPDCAYGAGCGFGLGETSGIRFPAAERGSGDCRVMTIWNPTAYVRSEVVEFTIWDWPAPANRICAQTTDGKRLSTQLLEEGTHYWGHHFTRIAVQTTIPAMGWNSIVLTDSAPTAVEIPQFLDPRVDHITDAPIILENQHIRAVFQADTMLLKSLVRKADRTELIDPVQGAGALRFITETADKGMSAWRVGQYAKIENLNTDTAVFVDFVKKGILRQEIGFHLTFHHSTIQVTVSLDSNSRRLDYKFLLQWREFGDENGIPQLNFHLPLAEKATISRCLTPLGFSDRPAIAQDVPCNGLIAAACEGGSISLLSDCKYGFRNDENALSVSLIRSSYIPDDTPEIGQHAFGVSVSVGDWERSALLADYQKFMHPVCALANTAHAGTLPLHDSLLSLQGAILYGLKQSESGDGYILRLFNPEPEEVTVEIEWHAALKSAETVSILECDTLQTLHVEERKVCLQLPACALRSVKLKTK